MVTMATDDVCHPRAWVKWNIALSLNSKLTGFSSGAWLNIPHGRGIETYISNGTYSTVFSNLTGCQ